MIRKEKNGVQWLEFSIFQGFSSLHHGVFLRHGGVSLGSWDSLNAGGGSGDSPNSIAINWERMREVLGCSHFFEGKQVHKTHIQNVVGECVNHSIECDGLVTQKKDVGLLIKHADCQAAVFYDPVKKIVGCVHLGWRGNVQNMYQKMVFFMRDRFQSKPENLFVGVSPSLGPCCGEFIHYQKELPKSFWSFQVAPDYFNLWEISRNQLLDSGILPSHMEIAGICTKCNPQDFFSYRREKISGRHATIACIF